ncbi:MAG TPA: transcription termination/antitermination NusG family protein [Terriglobales bacterium]|nr:transcription termination/antitermination NusG family protein [Terriglobales bacterium]
MLVIAGARLPASPYLYHVGFDEYVEEMAEMRQVAEAFDSRSVHGVLCVGVQGAQWFAVFTMPRHEKRVSAHCEQRQIETFLPLYKVRHRWKNRCTVDLELPLFPNYLFVRIAPSNRVPVLQVPGVVSIVSSAGQLLPVPGDYVAALRDGLLVHKIEPHTNLEAGELVRIKTGPLAGAEGILERRKNDFRVVLRLEMLARSVSVEVAASEIELRGYQSFLGDLGTQFPRGRQLGVADFSVLQR